MGKLDNWFLKVMMLCFAFVATILTVNFLFDYAFMMAIAQETVPAPTLSPDAQFLQQVWLVIQGFGGLTFVAKCSTVIMIIVGSMKVSFLRPLWTKLGSLQIWVAPILGFLGGLATAFTGQDKFSWAIVIAYTVAGAGAGHVHELLDLVKKVPGLGDVYMTIIDVIMEILGGAKVKEAEEALKVVELKAAK